MEDPKECTILLYGLVLRTKEWKVPHAVRTGVCSQTHEAQKLASHNGDGACTLAMAESYDLGGWRRE